MTTSTYTSLLVESMISTAARSILDEIGIDCPTASESAEVRQLAETIVRETVDALAAVPGEIDAAIANAETACGGWSGWWGEDTKPGGAVKTEAKAEIWSDPKGFEAAGMAYMTAVAGVKASTDEASFKAAFPALGKACQGCHEKFRQADD